MGSNGSKFKKKKEKKRKRKAREVGKAQDVYKSLFDIWKKW